MNALHKQFIVAIIAFALSIVFVVAFDSRGTEKEYMQANQVAQEQDKLELNIAAPIHKER